MFAETQTSKTHLPAAGAQPTPLTPNTKAHQPIGPVPSLIQQLQNNPKGLTAPKILHLHSLLGNQGIQRQLPAAKPLPTNSGPRLQRHVFINERQIKEQPATSYYVLFANPRYFYYADDHSVVAPEEEFSLAMVQMIKDGWVRNYTSLDEFKQHAHNQTDYLGNLLDGTWVRFSPIGLNILGERHTEVTLREIIQAVRSQSFIYEPFSSDDLAASPNLKKTYEIENDDKFFKLGIDRIVDKLPFGAESLFPKMGYALTNLLPYFTRQSSMADLTPPNYSGQPYQRYLKLAWAYAKDIWQAKQNSAVLDPDLDKLADTYGQVEGKLDGFITTLPLDGYLGDAFYLVQPNALLGGGQPNPQTTALLPGLAQFTQAFVAAMLELAAREEAARLNAEFTALAQARGHQQASKAQENIFTKWRNLKFTDNVIAAAHRGVRYAGMGNNHLNYLLREKILTPTMHPYNITSNGAAMQAFKATTEKLKKVAI